MLNILFLLVIIAYLAAQIILTITSIQDGYTFKEVVHYSQDKKVGKIFMTIFYLPAYFIMYLYSLLPINTKSCFDEKVEEEIKESKYYTLADIISMAPSTSTDDKVFITPENYYDLIKFANMANKNKDVEIHIDTNVINEQYLDCSAFYGVRIGVYHSTSKPDGIKKYYISCFHATRKEVLFNV